MADEQEPIPTDPSNLSIKPSSSQAIQPQVECKGIRSTSDFPRELSGLSQEQVEHHYKAMRNSHASLMRSRGQLQRRSREFSEARLNFINTLRTYEERLVAIGEEKAEAMRLAQDMHKELEGFENKQQACCLFSNPSSSLCMSCLLYTSPSPRDKRQSRMPSSA